MANDSAALIAFFCGPYVKFCKLLLELGLSTWK